MYNQYNLEATSFNFLISNFKKYLIAEKISNGSIRSYLSDLRHFLSWLELFLAAQGLTQIRENPLAISENQFIGILKHVNERVLSDYKIYLTSNNVPLKTINRRFSSLRRFGEFSKDQNWCNLNPFDALRNISLNQPFPENEFHLGEFKNELWKKGLTKISLKNYLADVKQFLSWTDSRRLLADLRGSNPESQISANPPAIRGNHK